MAASRTIGMVDATFDYFKSLGDWYKDPAGLDAVRQIRDRMVQDLEALDSKSPRSKLAELCKEWRALRIEPTGRATYPPDMFIESVCRAIEIS